MNHIKKNYVVPSIEKICVAREDVLTLSDSTVTGTFDGGARVEFGDFN